MKKVDKEVMENRRRTNCLMIDEEEFREEIKQYDEELDDAKIKKNF